MHSKCRSFQGKSGANVSNEFDKIYLPSNDTVPPNLNLLMNPWTGIQSYHFGLIHRITVTFH